MNQITMSIRTEITKTIRRCMIIKWNMGAEKISKWEKENQELREIFNKMRIENYLSKYLGVI